MEIAYEFSILGRPLIISRTKSFYLLHCNRVSKIPFKISQKNYQYLSRISSKFSNPHNFRPPSIPTVPRISVFDVRPDSKSLSKANADLGIKENAVKGLNLELLRLLGTRGLFLGAMVCGVLVVGCKRVFAAEGVVNAGYGVIGQSILSLRNAWPKLSQLLTVFKEQGLILAALLGLSAFFFNG